MSLSHRRHMGGLYDAIYTYDILYTHTHTQLYNIIQYMLMIIFDII